MTFKEIERLLKSDGWHLKTTKGSHHQYVHDTKKGKVTIPRHHGDLDIRTANSILKMAGIKEADKK